MDGNNRFSKKKNISSFDGYQLGAKKLIDISNYLFNNTNVEVISAFALSKNNTKRPKYIINTIKKVFELFLDNNLKKDFKFSIKFRGDLNFFSKSILEKIFYIEKLTSKNHKKLNIFLNYSGQFDILNSAIKTSSKKLTKTIFEKNLITGSIIPPDLLIRTGGYQRLSDFFLYQISFTELFFFKKTMA